MGALTEHERRVMHNAGFIKEEIDIFNNAVDVNGNPQDLNFRAENFQSMIRSRIRWIALLKSKGWDRFQINFRIKLLYAGHRSKRTSFMLLQIENSPAQHSHRITDNAEFRRRLVRTRVTKTLGEAYGKPFKTTPLPRHVPAPKRLPGLE
jgi:hypothetical protein